MKVAVPKQTVCLSMIVKNEAPVIASCLASVLPIIDHWVICDTGSTDGTQDVIRDFFRKHDKPGELHQRPWQDFAHNRTEALALARPCGDYTLIIDADDTLVLPPRYKRPFLSADSYTLDIVHQELRHARTQLIRSALPWRYEGVLHEFLSYSGPDGARIFPETKSQRSLAGVEIHVGEEGARRRSDAAARFARDAQALSNALLTETDPFLISRYTFYLAQSQADSGDKESALETYLKRATLGFWQQEVFISLYEAARIKAELAHDENDVIAAFARAAEADRNRAEALHGGARYCRERGRHQQGYEFAKRGVNLRPPPGALFVQPWIYEYGLLDELAVNAYWTGDYNACLQACRRLLKLGGRLPANYRSRVEANARFARDKLREPPVLEPIATIDPDSASPEPLLDPAAEPPPAAQQQSTGAPEPEPNAQQQTPTEHAAPAPHIPGSGKTLHVLGVAHTIPHEDYLVCAFTGKVLAFPDLVQPHGWHVVEYSNEGSASNAREHIAILTRQRLQELSKRRSRDEPMDADVTNEPLQSEFQRILVDKIKARAQPGDIVCHVYGPNMQVVDALPKCHHVESSVGYTASPGLHFRIYESSAWMHWHLGKAGREDGSNYNWVIPSSFDVRQWPYCGAPKDYAVYLGRVTPRKGMATLVEIARRMPDLPIHVYGPGDPTQWAKDGPPTLLFKGPIFGAARAEAIRQACCMLMPTVYVEPFGFSGIEAQLCGVPLIGTSFGAFQETIIDGVTGYRCHTLADWIAAIRRSATLDRKQISDLARQRYSREVIGQQYNWVLQQLADLSGPGWYGEVSRKFPDPPPAKPQRQPRIWLYMPHFGAVPKYFQLYLDSLARNADLLSVIFITDVDLSSFSLPDNLIVVTSTLDAERERAATFLREALGIDVAAASLLTTPYKFVDFKITYLDLFRDIGADHGVTEHDYVGWGDCDLIYGRLGDFISLDTDYAVIGGFHGHFTAFRNIEPLRTLYRRVEQLPSILLDNHTHIADEIAFRPYLLKYLEETSGQMFYTNRYFCDVVPEQFFGLFRNDHSSRPKNFFDAYNSDKDIDHIHCDQDGRLIVHYDDGNKREAIYCHLQKRKMALTDPRQPTPFLIQQDAFAPVLPPPVANTADTGESSTAESAPAVAASSASLAAAPQGPNLGTFGEESLIDQHALRPARNLHSVQDASPRVLVAILAKQKEAFLPFYLECIEALDYPKSAIVLYVRTNNNTDATETILRDWLARVGHLYAHAEFDATNVDVKVEQFGAHEWNAQRFQVLGHIRNVSLQAAKTHGCDYYFVADVDNFIRPCTLRELVALRLPIVSPLLRSIVPGAFYSNYHAEIDVNGYFRNCDQYQWILNRWVRGVVEVPVVHCTYLVRTDVIDQLTYLDGSDRYEYVVFSDSARKASVPQYVDNRQIYGYVTFGEGHDQHVQDGVERARTLLATSADRIPVQHQAVNDRSSASRGRTLVFCTAFGRTQEVWDIRYRRWLDAIKRSALAYHQILIVDDGSPVLPSWSDLPVCRPEDQISPEHSAALIHFDDNLGRWAGHNYPGWYRSFAYAAEYAKKGGFAKVVHIESDTFILDDQIFEFLNNASNHWIALWDGFYNMPETAIQVAEGKGLDLYHSTTRRPYSDFIHKVIEGELPFTRVERGFYGGKFLDFLDEVPRNAQFVVQATEEYSNETLWWLSDLTTKRHTRERIPGSPVRESQRASLTTAHGTVAYLDESSFELRHGPRGEVPDNVVVSICGNSAEVTAIKRDAVPVRLNFTATAAGAGELSSYAGKQFPRFIFEVRQRGGAIALRSGRRYLSADPGSGHLALAAREVAEWELFRLDLLPNPDLDRSPPIRLELGSGNSPSAGYVHHDRTRHAAHIDIGHDLNELPWPWEDESCEEILALDVFEHLQLMPEQWLRECHRILVSNGTIKLRVPAFGTPWHLIDPTHVRGFHPLNFDYFIRERPLWQKYGNYYFEFSFRDGGTETEGHNIIATIRK